MITVRYTEKNGTIGFIETSRFTFLDFSEMAEEYKILGFKDLSKLYYNSKGYELTFPIEGLVIKVKCFDVAINGKSQDEIFKRG